MFAIHENKKYSNDTLVRQPRAFDHQYNVKSERKQKKNVLIKYSLVFEPHLVWSFGRVLPYSRYQGNGTLQMQIPVQLIAPIFDDSKIKLMCY